VRGLVVVKQSRTTLDGRLLGVPACGHEPQWGAAQTLRRRDAQTFKNGRCQIRELYEPRLSRRARLQRSGTEVRPGHGDQAQARGDSRVGQAGKQNIRPCGCGLEHGGNPGVDGHDLLGTTGRRALLIVGVHVGRVADRTDVDQGCRTPGQSGGQGRVVERLVSVHHPVGPGCAQCRAGADGLEAAAVAGNLVAEQTERGIEPGGRGCREVPIPLRHPARRHSFGQGVTRRPGTIGSAAATAALVALAGLLPGGKGQPAVHRTGVGVDRVDRQSGGRAVP